MTIGPFRKGKKVQAAWLQWMLDRIMELTNIVGVNPVTVSKTPAGYAIALQVDYTMRTGTIVKINYDSADPKACLMVQQDLPSVDSATGRPKFYPLAAWETTPIPEDPPGTGKPDPVPVYVDGCPYELMGMFYAPGDRIRYWTAGGSGKYVTLLEDVSFWAEITPASGGVAKWPYDFTACDKSNIPFMGTLDQDAANEAFAHYEKPGGGTFTGTCYNLIELTHVNDGVATDGVGLTIDEDGKVGGTECVLKPIGRCFTKVFRFWNAETTTYTYYFLPISNAAG